MYIMSINNIIYKYVYHYTLRFLLYNLIQQQGFSMKYNLFIKEQNLSDINKRINNIFYNYF